MNNVTHNRSKILVLIVSIVLISALFLRINAVQLSDGQATTYIIPIEDWIKNDDTSAVRLVNMLLQEEVPVYWALSNFTVAGTTYPAGTFYIRTPFTTRLGVSSDDTMGWFMLQAKLNRVWRIDTTTENFTVNSKQLILPQIALFYDKTTYENALETYLRFRSLGFKIVLANAEDLYTKSWNESGSVLNEANVVVIPGGAVHFWSFPTDEALAEGIGNLTEFIKNGGGYIGVCAGTVEALQGVQPVYLPLVNASMTSRDMWGLDWRLLQGPLYINITQPSNPVMFGYGSDAVRPGYGPLTTIYYLGGPALCDLGANTTVLATYAGPITQQVMPSVNNTWGLAAVVAADYYDGKVVVFGPHPEYPGPVGRMYAQALYYIAKTPKPSRLEPAASQEIMSESAISECVNTIESTVNQIKPTLEDATRSAANIVNLRTGDYYNVLGNAVDEDLLSFDKEAYNQLNDLQRYTVTFQYEYSKLNTLKGMVQGDPQLVSLAEYGQAMISNFFNYTENLPPEPHTVTQTDWTGDGPFMPFTQADEATKFESLPHIFDYVDNETNASLYPLAQNYSVVYREYNILNRENQTAYTLETNQTLSDLYQNITSPWPVGIYYVIIYSLFHTEDIVQYKIEYPLLNMLTLADRVNEVISYVEYALGSAVGPWNYASAEIQAFIAHPQGPFV
ncbi:MAG: BPL-N domain-containing protein [Candidatus Bathyarchaeia archaeon]|jgi:glutamine amidotransferase-like uncharacterized protein